MFRLDFVAHENGAIHKPRVSVVGMLSLKVSHQSAQQHFQRERQRRHLLRQRDYASMVLILSQKTNAARKVRKNCS